MSADGKEERTLKRTLSPEDEDTHGQFDEETVPPEKVTRVEDNIGAQDDPLGPSTSASVETAAEKIGQMETGEDEPKPWTRRATLHGVRNKKRAVEVGKKVLDRLATAKLLHEPAVLKETSSGNFVRKLSVAVELESEATKDGTNSTIIDMIEDWCEQRRHTEPGVFLELDKKYQREKYKIRPNHSFPIANITFGVLNEDGRFSIVKEANREHAVDSDGSSDSDDNDDSTGRRERCDLPDFSDGDDGVWDGDLEEYSGLESLYDDDFTPTPFSDIQFEHAKDTLNVCKGDGRTIYRLKYSYRHLDPRLYIDMKNENNETAIQLYVTHLFAPRIFKGAYFDPKEEDYPQDPDEWNRTDSFGPENRRDLVGKSNAIRVSFPFPGTEEERMSLLHRLGDCGFTIYYGHVVCKQVELPAESFDADNNFDMEYAWESLRSRGHMAELHMSSRWVSMVTRDASREPGRTSSALFYAGQELERNPRASIQEAYATAFRQQQFAENASTLELPRHYAYVRRAILTPTRLLFVQPDPTLVNRIVRKYGGPDAFMRLSIRDEDMDRLLAINPTGLKELLETRFLQELQTGVPISSRHFDYLGSSNSQLREHGMWLYCGDGSHTAEEIRQNIGDLQHIRCVARYVSRLGQAFSASAEPSVEITPDIVREIPDVKSGGHTFTDGIGKISPSLARKVADDLRYTVVPSAFQVRHAGYKGVLAIDPELKGDVLAFREDSMRKFKAQHNRLEVLAKTSPLRLHTNKQVLMLMEGLGVPTEPVMKLQANMLRELADMLLKEPAAFRALKQIRTGVSLKALREAGLRFTTEPFFRSMLQTLYYDHLHNLVKRTRIAIPADKGRMLMGVVDEYECLGKDEVFVQFSRDLGEPADALSPRKRNGKTTVMEKEVVITKNPCMHPGDLRKYRAVDKPRLHHLVDCVVFPTTSDRPLPDMMSGSDLDGDMYFVCWDDELIPQGENKEPMDFTKAEEKKLDGPVQLNDILTFLVDYVNNDKLGRIANTHLAQSDQEEKGIFSDICMTLCQLHSDAVDFPKTGAPVDLKSKYKPVKYPDFMMKFDKESYHSKKLIGKLFREARSLEDSGSFQHEGIDSSEVTLDRDISGDLGRFSDEMLKQAREEKAHFSENVESLMKLYGIKSEGEVSSGCIINMRATSGCSRNEKQTTSHIVRARMEQIRRKTRERFFTEFGGEKAAQENRPPEMLVKASCWYYVTYSPAERTLSGEALNYLGFPWVVHELIAELKASSSGGLYTSPNVGRNASDSLSGISKSVNLFVSTLNLPGGFADRQYRAGFLLNDAFRQKNGLSLISSLEVFLFEIWFAFCDSDARVIEAIRSMVPARVEKCVGTTVVNTEFFRVLLLKNEKQQQDWSTFVQESTDLVASCPWLVSTINVLREWARKSYITVGPHADVLDIYFTAICLHVLKALFSLDGETSAGQVNCSSLEQIEGSPSLLQFSTEEHDDSLLQLLLKLADADATSQAFTACSARIRLWRLTGVNPKKWMQVLSNRAFYAYHTLAKTGSVRTLVGSHLVEEGRSRWQLSGYMFRHIIYAETFASRALSDYSGAQVSCSRIELRGRQVVIVEAHGTHEQRFKVELSLQEFEGSQGALIASEHQHITTGHVKLIFEGCTGPSNSVEYQDYTGELNPDHVDKRILRPVLTTPAFQSCLPFRKFMELMKEIKITLDREFNPLLHGDIEFAVMFGKVYLIDPYGTGATLAEVEAQIDRCKPHEPGWNKRRKRKRRKKGAPIPPDEIRLRHGWKPRDVSKASETILSFLEDSGFHFDEEEALYRCSMHKLGKGGSREGILCLDKKLQLMSIWYPNTTWGRAALKRKDVAGCETDIRFFFNSKRRMDPLNLPPESDLKKVLEEGKYLAFTDDQKGIRVCYESAGKYGPQIDFVRQTRRKRYCYHFGSNTDAEGVKVTLQTVLEYSKRNAEGHFETVLPERLELQMVCPAKDWIKLPWDEFSQRLSFVWDTANTLASFVDASSV